MQNDSVMSVNIFYQTKPCNHNSMFTVDRMFKCHKVTLLKVIFWIWISWRSESVSTPNRIQFSDPNPSYFQAFLKITSWHHRIDNTSHRRYHQHAIHRDRKHSFTYPKFNCSKIIPDEKHAGLMNRVTVHSVILFRHIIRTIIPYVCRCHEAPTQLLFTFKIQPCNTRTLQISARRELCDQGSVADLRGATGGHGPPKRSTKFFFTLRQWFKLSNNNNNNNNEYD